MKSIRVSVLAPCSLVSGQDAIFDLLVFLNQHSYDKEFIPSIRSDPIDSSDMIIQIEDGGNSIEFLPKSLNCSANACILKFIKHNNISRTWLPQDDKWIHFTTISQVKLRVLEECLRRFLGKNPHRALTVHNSEIVMNGKSALKMDELPFALNNPKWCSLRHQLEQQGECVREYAEKLRHDPSNETLFETLNAAYDQQKRKEDELRSCESGLLDMAIQFAEVESCRRGVEFKQAQVAFEQGYVSEARKMLPPLSEIRERDRNVDAPAYHYYREVLFMKMEALIGVGDRFFGFFDMSSALRLYKEADDIAVKLNLGFAKRKRILDKVRAATVMPNTNHNA